MNKQWYIICYDISDNRKRNRVATLLESMGQRVQKSVFECHLTAKEIETTREKLAKEINMETDSVRIFNLCENCRRATRVIGTGIYTTDEKIIIL